MTLEKIIIKEFSSSSQILNIFNCPSGKISIFDGPSETVSSLERLFNGTYEKNNLKIVVNNSINFNSLEHTLIGYNFIIKDLSKTVEELFLEKNIAKDNIDTILQTYGLGDIKNYKIYELDADKKKRLEFAIAFQGENKALIIKSPFEDLMPQWKEPFAKYITTYATKKNLPVIISELDYEPASWLNEDFINKLHIGISTNKTIGFGSNNKELNELLNQIRNEIVTEKENSIKAETTDNEQALNISNIPTWDSIITNETPEVIKNNNEVKSKTIEKEEKKSFSESDLNRINKKMARISVFIFSILIILCGTLITLNVKKHNTEKEKRQKIVKEEIRKQKLLDKNKIDPHTLNHYPVSIKAAIEDQFTKKFDSKILDSLPLVRNRAQVKTKNDNTNLFMLLGTLSGTGKDIPDQINSNNETMQRSNNNNFSNNRQNAIHDISKVSDAETKRQLLYNKFQEAIRNSRVRR